MNFEKTSLLAEGKTKKIWAVKDDDKKVIIENKDDITAHDNPELTKKFGTKAKHSTTTTCRVFELLKQAGIPVAYEQQISSTEFLAQKCKMLPLEVVVRRFAVGSYLGRHPELIREGFPHRFHRLKTEFFLKTTGGNFTDHIGQTCIPSQGEEDPFILDPYQEEWLLCHPKRPSWADVSVLGTINATDAIIKGIPMIEKMENLVRQVFLTLEGAWNILGFRFIDLKIEFGIVGFELVVADVIDNDSWRLKTPDWKELSKQVFRDGGDLPEVEDNYRTVASLTKRFNIPKQALVFWRGSEKDKPINAEAGVPQLDILDIVLSGHKATRKCLEKLNELQGEYPGGGVIITKVGRSNGLGPILASHSTWPVISLPCTIDKHPEDAWSSLRMPSNVPMATVWPESNAVKMAFNILSRTNPAIYATRQGFIEELDELI